MTIVCAEYDPGRDHGHVTWRRWNGLPVVEIVNNWICRSFEDTYRSPLLADCLSHVLEAVGPDVVHVHNLLNLTFDLPELARAQGSAVVATLHDYTVLCPAGGQRIHRAEQHVCYEIDPERCVRCFKQSPFASQATFGRLAPASLPSGPLARGARLIRRFPLLESLVAAGLRQLDALAVTTATIEQRLAAARRALEHVDLVVAPSGSIADEFERFGVDRSRLRVSDYGFELFAPRARAERSGALRAGYVGTLAWHKGVHVLIEALRDLPAGTIELLIYGDPTTFSAYTADLRARAAGLPIRFMGPFDTAAVPDVYSQFDVLVVPSLWLENSPLVIHEAFMAGVPVIGARIGGIADLVDDGCTGLLYDPASPAALGSLLRELRERPALFDVLVDGVRRRQPVKSIAQDAREWEAVYGEALRRRSLAVQTV